jgi:RHS repeat-associated protein
LKIQYNRNRYYDYYTGRWTTHDPLGLRGHKSVAGPLRQYTAGMALYEYVGSHPIIGADPYGQFSLEPGMSDQEVLELIDDLEESIGLDLATEETLKELFYWIAYLFLSGHEHWREPLEQWYYEKGFNPTFYIGNGDPRNRDIINNSGFQELLEAWVAKTYCGAPLIECPYWEVWEGLGFHWEFAFPIPHAGGYAAYTKGMFFLGSYDVYATAKKKEDCKLDIDVLVWNETSWKSAAKTFKIGPFGGSWIGWSKHKRGKGPFSPSRGGDFEQYYYFELKDVPIRRKCALCYDFDAFFWSPIMIE